MIPVLRIKIFGPVPQNRNATLVINEDIRLLPKGVCNDQIFNIFSKIKFSKIRKTSPITKNNILGGLCSPVNPCLVDYCDHVILDKKLRF